MVGARGIDVVSRTTSSGNTVSYPLYEAHGNNVGALSKSGSSFDVSAEKSYDACRRSRFHREGGLRSGTNANGKAAYCANLGHKQDDESGLIYMRARYYEPTSGRFVSQDLGMDKFNWFIYCVNNPVNLIDSTGNYIEDPFAFSLYANLGNALMFGALAVSIAAKYAASPEWKVKALALAVASIGMAVVFYSAALGCTDNVDSVAKKNVMLTLGIISGAIALAVALIAFNMTIGTTGQGAIASSAIVGLSIQAAICLGELLAQEVEGSKP